MDSCLLSLWHACNIAARSLGQEGVNGGRKPTKQSHSCQNGSRSTDPGAGIRRNKAIEPVDDVGIDKTKPPDWPSRGRDARSLGVSGKLVRTPRFLTGCSKRRDASRGSIGGAEVGRIVGCSPSTGDRPGQGARIFERGRPGARLIARREHPPGKYEASLEAGRVRPRRAVRCSESTLRTRQRWSRTRSEGPARANPAAREGPLRR